MGRGFIIIIIIIKEAAEGWAEALTAVTVGRVPPLAMGVWTCGTWGHVGRGGRGGMWDVGGVGGVGGVGAMEHVHAGRQGWGGWGGCVDGGWVCLSLSVG